MTEEYSVGYSDGYQDGWNAAQDEKPKGEKHMSKIEPFKATWSATAALSCALDETEPDEQVIVVVRRKDGSRCKYVANITNMEVHWEAGILQHEVLSGSYAE